MKFLNYLNEDEINYEAIDLIKKNCSQFLKEGVPLYRGYESNKTFFSKTPRKDRKPTDTPQRLSDSLNREFKKKFGWKPRAEGVFCTPDHIFATDYGNNYLFFPFDGYKYIWSPTISDSYIHIIDTIADYLRDNLHDVFMNNTRTNSYVNAMNDKELDDFSKYFIDTNKYTNKNLKTNTYGQEVMVKCKKYYMLSLRRYRIDGYDFFEGAN